MLNTKEVIKDLEGNSFIDTDGSEQTYGRVIARILCRNKHAEAERCIEIAMKLLSEKEVELSPSEINMVKDIVKQDAYTNNMLEYNIFQYISKNNSSSTK